ncbi:hypothetical protein FDC62_13315 [Clostridium botulinum]|uniref:hypothetical protein n=1 Tax=Clostridium botulinum TaxID=1491 RepID=UPI000AAE5AD1|nr:hypothetical protein [Clostridium botulinum]NFO99138.1 hypothetical protein [Clostridium botulinum]
MPLDVPQNSYKKQNKFNQFIKLQQNIIKEKSRTTDEILLITNIDNDTITDILFSLELNEAQQSNYI